MSHADGSPWLTLVYDSISKFYRKDEALPAEMRYYGVTFIAGGSHLVVAQYPA